MKSKLLLLLMVLSVLNFSCTNENSIEEIELNSSPDNVEIMSRGLPGSGGIGVLGAIIEDTQCFNSQGTMGYTYKLYAVAIEGTKPYARIAHISVVKTVAGQSNEIEGKSLLIPANANASSTVSVFTNNNNSSIGAVSVRVDSIVKADGTADPTIYTTYNGNYTITNCYETTGVSPCDGSGAIDIGEGGLESPCDQDEIGDE